ncbi:hypothetical protein TREES_T100016912 [Tupaia chinensis]|uniref:Uncharacterized protein n=1 Tax=Tupaia chinensis TaxID=246437 RepID=L9KX48_TUPCH|nr:hypothetical protein TREES_T100016912 [Tupaia chinensis]
MRVGAWIAWARGPWHRLGGGDQSEEDSCRDLARVSWLWRTRMGMAENGRFRPGQGQGLEAQACGPRRVRDPRLRLQAAPERCAPEYETGDDHGGAAMDLGSEFNSNNGTQEVQSGGSSQLQAVKPRTICNLIADPQGF